MISRRTAVRLLGGGVVVAATAGLGLATCDTMPAEAIAGWKGPAPAETDPRRRALSYALLAPNPHNMQSWLADLRDEGTITLWTDRARLLPETDPPARQITIGCGCFLELCMMALAEQGIAARLSLFPDGGATAAEVGREPFARIVLDGQGGMKDRLFEQVLHRRSTKTEYANRLPETSALSALDAAIEGFDGAHTVFTDAAKVAELRTIALNAWRIEIDTDRTYRESAELMRVGAEEIARHRDGIELHGPFIWWAKRLGLMTLEAQMPKDSVARRTARDMFEPLLAATPAFGMLTTASNDRMTQIATGQAYVRLNLAATSAGLSMAPVSQVLQEFPEMREEQARLLKAADVPQGHTAQMLWRLGYATASDPTPRRPLDAILMA